MKVIVVGGGVMGMACAWRLAGRGAGVELFDRRTCGGGATLAALGALWPASPLATGPLQELHRASLWQFEEFLGALKAAGGGTVGFRRMGRIELLHSAKAASRAREEAEAACRDWPAFAPGKPTMEVLSVLQIAAEQPDLIAGEATAALLCRATAQVEVAQLVVALQTACRKAGVAVHDLRAVDALAIEEGRVSGVRVGEETVSADAVLVTAGAWTPLLDLVLARAAPIVPAKGQGLAIARPPSLELRHIVKSGTLYLIPWDDEILVGSTTEPKAGFDEAPTDKAREALLSGAGQIVPALAGVEFRRHWAGLRPQGPGKAHHPVMGPVPGAAGLFVCAGHYKTGIGMAPLVSQLMAQAILDGQTPEALGPFLPGN